MSYDIFISYRRVDGDHRTSGTYIARTIKQHLEINGYKDRVFFDYSELDDDEFETVILSAIEQCRVFVLVLSRDSMMRCVNDGDWVRREIMQAKKCGLKIIPIEPDNLFNGYPENFPSELDVVKNIHHAKIHMDSSFERDMQAVIDKRISKVVPKCDAVSNKGALVRIDTDCDCRILRFGENIGIAYEGTSEIRLPRGKHKLTFLPLANDVEPYECVHTVSEIDFEDLIEVRLKKQNNSQGFPFPLPNGYGSSSGVYKISDGCLACGTCIDECPVEAISAGDIYVIDPDMCIGCGTCASVCPCEAISAE